MSEENKSKKLWIPYYLTPAMLLFIIGIMMTNYTKIKDNEYRSFDSTAQKEAVIRHTENVTFSEMESFEIVTHAKDTIAHMSKKERQMYYVRMKRYDSIMTVFLEEQWSQGQRLRRMEIKINALN